MLWVGLHDQADALAGLAARVQAAVGGCGFEVDPRPFQPHVTLGRPGPRFDLQAWRRELEEPLEPPAVHRLRGDPLRIPQRPPRPGAISVRRPGRALGGAGSGRRTELMSPDRPRWLSLPELRTRRSYKWRAYPADVLPTFVAEMDVTLAEPVTRVLQEAIAAGDTGYATPDPELAAAVASFHLARFGWQLDPAGVQPHPRRDDRRHRGPPLRPAARERGGRSTRRCTRPSSATSGARGAGWWRPRSPAPAMDTRWTSTRSRRPSPREPAPTSSAIPTTRPGWCSPWTSSAGSPSWPSVIRSWCSPTRSMRR